MASRKLLITGATGKQGGAVIEALLSHPTPFHILALTRNPKSSKALSLAANPNITVVEGDPASPAAIFDAFKPIYGVFSVTVPSKKHDEEAQAKALIDESIKNGVEHFVFTSVDRGGEGVSEKTPTEIPHFMSKHRIEEYLKEKTSAAGSKMGWTILRPVAFLDNLTPDFMGKAFASMWYGLGDKPLQLVSTHDIGVFAARAFNDPGAYNQRAISLAGDELTLDQGKKIFKEVVGYDMPETFRFVGTAINFMIKEVRAMFAWFKEAGYGADIPKLRMEEPELQDFSKWLKESSKFPKK